MEYYRSHWVTIEPERLARYDEFLQWVPQMEPLLDGFGLEEAECVVDYGCGPGWASLALLQRMGGKARVVACDLNRELLALGEQHAAEAGLAERLEWRQVTDDRVPLPDGSADRVFCKNVLEYVPSMDETLSEFRRVLRPGGIVRLIDSDWDLLTVEPLGSERIRELLGYARQAYNDAQAGRHMYGATRRAGFTEVTVRVAAPADTEGRLRVVLQNMAGYAVEAGYPREKADGLLEEVDGAVERGELLVVLPQFIVTAVAP